MAKDKVSVTVDADVLAAADADAKAGSAGAGLVARARAGSSTGRNFPPLAVNPSVTTLAVAVADVGEFAAAHPNGR